MVQRGATAEPRKVTRVGGGCINHCFRARLANGRYVFLKENESAPADFFKAEAAGLQALKEAGAPVPGVLDCGPDHLMLEWIEEGRPGPSSMEALGLTLASLHGEHGPAFGFHTDNYCGETPQHNTRMEDGFAFFAECRLLPQGVRARDSGYLGSSEMERLERLCRRLPSLIPRQPPSLIHGDLWSGNVLFNDEGKVFLIDPAASWCWAEADLAMTRLFGGFSEAFYRSYESVRALEPGFDKRVAIYNLYHLLNHLNLFGTSYLGGVKQVLREV